MNLSKKQKKIAAGVGITGGLGLLFILLKARFGFGNTPVEQWRRTTVRSSVANTRGEVNDLQSKARARKIAAQKEAEKKQRYEDAANAARERKEIARWEQRRKLIESN